MSELIKVAIFVIAIIVPFSKEGARGFLFILEHQHKRCGNAGNNHYLKRQPTSVYINGRTQMMVRFFQGMSQVLCCRPPFKVSHIPRRYKKHKHYNDNSYPNHGFLFAIHEGLQKLNLN